MIAVAVQLGACGRTPVVAADPSGSTPTTGDTNGDGRVDLSDGLVLLRAQLSGAQPAVCMGAADIDQDHRVDLGDGFAIWYHLFAGNTTLHAIEDGWCDTWETMAAAPEGRMALTLDGPRKADGEAQVLVALTSPDLGAEGWSLAAVAEGCTITAATVAGTLGADLRDSPAGARDGGFERTELRSGVASSAVVLSWERPLALAPSEEEEPLLALTLAPEGEGCGTCVVRLEDGHATGGEPVTNLISVGGRSYRPALPELSLKLCAE